MLIRHPDYLIVALGAAAIGGGVVAIVSTARKGAVCHMVTLAALLVMLLAVMAGCANYPGLTDRCVPLYGGGGFIPFEQIIVTNDGGAWTCS